MQYSPRLDDLKVLECFLQDQLHAHMGRVVPFKVQCVFKDNMLWVLAQHPPEIVVDTQETFRVLEKVLQAEQPHTQLPVKLYLRTIGTKQPYSTENFIIYPLVRERLSGEAAPAIDETELHVQEKTEDGGEPEQHNHPDQPEPIPAEDPQVNRAKQILDRLAQASGTAELNEADLSTPLPKDGVDTLTEEETVEQLSLVQITDEREPSSSMVQSDEGEAFAHDIQSAFSPSYSAKPKIQLTTLLIGGAAGLALLGLGAFGATRPCVLGACPQIQQSQSLAEKSWATISRPATGKEILNAQAELHQSIAQLKTIPFWSGSYPQAQTDLQNYQGQATMLDIAVEGMKKAVRASIPTSKQPISQTAWQESQKLWEGAIADLQKVSADSKVYPLAQQKLVEYQKKLESVKQNITSEVNAAQSLASAKSIAITTAQQQTAAQSLEQWQVVQKRWQEFGNQISSIPNSSIVREQAQTLQKVYQPQIAAVDDKLGKEKAVGITYDRAQTTAKTAQKYQQDKKLEESLAQWNRAISILQNIPKDSTYEAKAQGLLPEYSKSMQQVEIDLIFSKKKAQAVEDLKKTCDGKPQVCSYTVADRAITVKLLPEYAKTVRNTAVAATNEGDDNAKLGLIKHVNSLGNALEAVSDNSQIPIQLYSDDGKLIQNYAPRKS